MPHENVEANAIYAFMVYNSFRIHTNDIITQIVIHFTTDKLLPVLEGKIHVTALRNKLNGNNKEKGVRVKITND